MAAHAEGGVDVADRIVSSSEDEDEEEGQYRGKRSTSNKVRWLLYYISMHARMHTPALYNVNNLSLCDEYLYAELSEIPLGELQKMREKLGTKK